MGLLTQLIEKRSAPGNIANPSQSFVDWMGGGAASYSGKTVTPLSAMQISTVYGCIRVRAETTASLPFIIYKRIGEDEKRRGREHPLYTLLHDSPNPEMTAFTWKEIKQSHIDLWGNCYSEIEWGDDGYPKALWPLRPDTTWPERDPKTKKIVYKTILADGKGVVLPAENVLHIPGLGFDGIQGYSPIRMAMNTFGNAMALEEYGGKFFKNGGRPSGVITHPGALQKESKDRMRESWELMYNGLDNAHRVAILEQGVTYQAIGVKPEEAQFLESRKFSREEIACIYRVPPHLLQDLERSTNNNIEHQSLEFVMYTMLPTFVRWEQAVNWKCFTAKERKKFFAEYLIDSLLRGDMKSRYEAYAIARQNGWMSANTILRKENMNPIEGGDKVLVNGNMIPIDMAGQQYMKGGDGSASSNTGKGTKGNTNE